MEISPKIDPAALLEKLRALPRRTGGHRGKQGPALSPADIAAIRAEEAERVALGGELAKHNRPIHDEINKCTWYPDFNGIHPLRVPDGKKSKVLILYLALAEEAIAKRNLTLDLAVEP